VEAYVKTYEAREIHDWSDIRALGDAVVCELVGIITKTRTGIHVPDTARLDVWVVAAVGPQVKAVAVGDRVMFGGQGLNNVDGRVFATRKEEEIIAVLGMPEVAAEQDADVPEVVPGNKAPANPRAPSNNGAQTLARQAERARIIRPR
jgi:co-chaperonin GroES (HSP10)